VKEAAARLLALTVAALANFAAVVHADEGTISASGVAPPQPKQSYGHLLLALGIPMSSAHPNRRVTLATIVGSGTLGAACNAENNNGDRLNEGLYRDSDISDYHPGEHTWCCGPGTSKHTCYNCDNDKVTCTDGKL
jgi:hypothetical protein